MYDGKSPVVWTPTWWKLCTYLYTGPVLPTFIGQIPTISCWVSVDILKVFCVTDYSCMHVMIDQRADLLPQELLNEQKDEGNGIGSCQQTRSTRD